MLVRTAGRCAAVLVVLAGSVTVAPAAGAQGTAAGAGPSASASALVSVSSMPAEAPARFLSTPRGDPMPPPDARRYASRYLATAPVDDGVPERIAGADRYATAAQVARQFGTADAVIVANGTYK
jgi:hypothetical protein